jgi:pyruvate formate lyase activating enzyme
MVGKISSIQTMGTLDGPGVRFTAFLQGCNLRCGCCHNPETWSIDGGDEFTPEALVEKVCRYTEYFGTEGGITLSGGEPLLQAEFSKEVFCLCKEKGINTCIDTSGSVINEAVLKLLDYTDRVLLDIKYTTDEQYLKFVGCPLETPLEFLKLLEQKQIPVTLRQVIIPTLNDNGQNIEALNKIVKTHKCIDKVELLPFKKICQTKYDNLGLEFRFKDIPSADIKKVKELEALIRQNNTVRPVSQYHN